MGFNNHLSVGNLKVTHKFKDISTSLGSNRFEDFINSMDSMSYKEAIVIPGYEHRADLISNLFYDTPIYDWLICLFNGISDPFEQLKVFDPIRIPILV